MTHAEDTHDRLDAWWQRKYDALEAKRLADVADARRAALELAIKALAEMPTSRGWTAYETLLHGQREIRALLDSAARVEPSGNPGELTDPAACSCTITRHERQENRACPVHFPAVSR